MANGSVITHFLLEKRKLDQEYTVPEVGSHDTANCFKTKNFKLKLD